MSQDPRIIPVNIEDEMKTAYIDYSMSVIVSRALPDVRDGLKPVHRRVLFGMHELGMTYNKAHKKSARIVGEVLGKYHPHGDTSVYDAMVRMAQTWSLRYPLIDGQGNFGSMDGDSPAAMRYTEARMKRITDELLSDLEKDTVNYTLNFDDTLEEPTVMPAKFPNLLVNGASGIAVGMATNILPHNLTEVINGTIAMIDNPAIEVADMIQIIKAPDFPTGGIIYGYEGVREGFETGRGRVVVRGRTEIETSANGREAIIVTEIPYQVNKAQLVAKIAELVNEKKLLGISDIRDESDRQGLRVVIEIKRDAIANVVLSSLFKYTPLQTSYGINNVALVNGRPRTLGLMDFLREFIKFRVEVVTRRTQFELRKALERAHLLEGLLVAIDDLDEVINLIRSSKNPEEAKELLMAKAFHPVNSLVLRIMEIDAKEVYFLSDIQAKAILEMRLQRLTGLEREKVANEYEELLKMIEHYRLILANEGMKLDIIKGELAEIRDRYGDERRTEISYADGEISIEDMIADEEMVVTISHLGYIKRTKSSEYKTQGRGGRGSMGSKTRNEDFIEQMFVANTLNYLLLFTEKGRCYWLRVWEIPEVAKTASGRVIQNIINLPQDDKVKAFIIVKDLTDREFLQNNYIIFCTQQGQIKKTTLEDYSRPRISGIQAITIHEEDQLLEAKLTNGTNEILLASRNGKAIRFNERTVRPMGRTAAGVRGILLEDDQLDRVVGMVCVDPNDTLSSILVLSEKGLGKRSYLDDPETGEPEYRVTNRGGKGVKTINVTDKTGLLIAMKLVKEDEGLMITNKSGITIRIHVKDLRIQGRATQGVKIIRLDESDSIADVAVTPPSDEDDENMEMNEDVKVD